MTFSSPRLKIISAFKNLFIASVCACLASCAVVQSSSTKAPNYSQKIERITIQSELANVNFLSGPIGPSAPFPETFQRALLTEFTTHGIPATYAKKKNLIANSFFGSNDQSTADQVMQGDTLAIRVKQTSYQKNILIAATFDLTLVSGITGLTIWSANIVVDSSIEVPHWGEAAANKLANEIATLLQKDGLI